MTEYQFCVIASALFCIVASLTVKDNPITGFIFWLVALCWMLSGFLLLILPLFGVK